MKSRPGYGPNTSKSHTPASLGRNPPRTAAGHAASHPKAAAGRDTGLNGSMGGGGPLISSGREPNPKEHLAHLSGAKPRMALLSKSDFGKRKY